MTNSRKCSEWPKPSSQIWNLGSKHRCGKPTSYSDHRNALAGWELTRIDWMVHVFLTWTYQIIGIMNVTLKIFCLMKRRNLCQSLVVSQQMVADRHRCQSSITSTLKWICLLLQVVLNVFRMCFILEKYLFKYYFEKAKIRKSSEKSVNVSNWWAIYTWPMDLSPAACSCKFTKMSSQLWNMILFYLL